MRLKTVYLVLMFGGMLSHSSCQLNRQEHEKHVQNPEEFCLNDQLKRTTKIVQIEKKPVQQQLTLSGKIEYNENDLVAFRSLLEGVVLKVHFEVGDFIKKGSVLAVIRSPEVQQLDQRRHFLTKQIRLLNKTVENKREMAKDGLVSGPELLTAEHELATAIIDLEGVEKSLEFYQALGEGTFQILAPKDGYIIQKSISPGQSITQDSEPLFAISNLQEIWAMVNIYASNLRFIDVGDEVLVRTMAYPDRFYDGKIDRIYNVFDDDEHVLKARVVLRNPDLMLMPGLGADIIINLDNNQEEAYAIPNHAKVFNDDKEYVVVQKSDCDFEIRQISPIATNEDFTFVRENIAEGDRIIASNVLLIFEQLNR